MDPLARDPTPPRASSSARRRPRAAWRRPSISPNAAGPTPGAPAPRRLGSTAGRFEDTTLARLPSPNSTTGASGGASPAVAAACFRARRRPRNKLGFALQLCVLRPPGRLAAPGEFVSPAVVDFIERQLDLDGDELADYAVRSETRHEHLAELRRLYGFRSFSGGAARELADPLREEAETGAVDRGRSPQVRGGLPTHANHPAGRPRCGAEVAEMVGGFGRSTSPDCALRPAGRLRLGNCIKPHEKRPLPLCNRKRRAEFPRHRHKHLLVCNNSSSWHHTPSCVRRC